MIRHISNLATRQWTFQSSSLSFWHFIYLATMRMWRFIFYISGNAAPVVAVPVGAGKAVVHLVKESVVHVGVIWKMEASHWLVTIKWWLPIGWWQKQRIFIGWWQKKEVSHWLVTKNESLLLVGDKKWRFPIGWWQKRHFIVWWQKMEASHLLMAVKIGFYWCVKKMEWFSGYFMSDLIHLSKLLARWVRPRMS